MIWNWFDYFYNLKYLCILERLNFKNCNKAKTLYLDSCFNTVYYRSIFISQSNKGSFFTYIDKTRWVGVTGNVNNMHILR